MNDFRHIFIVGHPRTGGTWLGKLLDACNNVRYLWEPDAPNHKENVYGNWEFDDPEKYAKRVMEFQPHVPIKPEFEKTHVDTVVIKLWDVLHSGCHHRELCETNYDYFDMLLEKHEPVAVLLTIRHPVRYAASLMRYVEIDPDSMKKVMSHYVETTLNFIEKYKDNLGFRIIQHETLTMETEDTLDTIMDHCQLWDWSQLADFLDATHAEDTPGHPMFHHNIMRKETVMNRWYEEDLHGLLVKHGGRLAQYRMPEYYPEPIEVWHEAR